MFYFSGSIGDHYYTVERPAHFPSLTTLRYADIIPLPHLRTRTLASHIPSLLVIHNHLPLMPSRFDLLFKLVGRGSERNVQVKVAEEVMAGLGKNGLKVDGKCGIVLRWGGHWKTSVLMKFHER